MLDERVRREFNLGCAISYQAIKSSAKPGSPEQQKLALQKLQSFEHGHVTNWEAMGYLAGVVKGAFRHPLATYHIFTER